MKSHTAGCGLISVGKDKMMVKVLNSVRMNCRIWIVSIIICFLKMILERLIL